MEILTKVSYNYLRFDIKLIFQSDKIKNQVKEIQLNTLLSLAFSCLSYQDRAAIY